MPDFNLSALSHFSNAALANDNTIAQVNPENHLQIAGNNDYKGVLGAIFRSDAEKANNNAARTELLRSLGQAFGLNGMTEADGKVRFSKDFTTRLQQLLGPELKLKDFGINADGFVTSGKPLTKRRISAIINKATVVGTPSEFSLDSYIAKASALETSLKSQGLLKSQAGQNLSRTLQAAVVLLIFMDRQDPATHEPRKLLKFNALYDPNEKSHKFDLTLPANARQSMFKPLTSYQDLDKILKDFGLGLDCGLSDAFELMAENVDQFGEVAIEGFNNGLKETLQNFVKTTCDAWSQGQLNGTPANGLVQAFSGSQNMTAFAESLTNQAVEAD